MAAHTITVTHAISRWNVIADVISRNHPDRRYDADESLVYDVIANVIDCFVDEEDRSAEVTITFPAWAAPLLAWEDAISLACKED